MRWRLLRKLQPLRCTPCRSCHSDMLEFFGREASPPEGGLAPLSRQLLSRETSQPDTLSDAARLLEHFETEAYVTANSVSPSTQQRTLEAIRKTLSAPSTRFTVENDSLWRRSLRVLSGTAVPDSHGSATPRLSTAACSLDSVAECCSALLLSRRGVCIPDLVLQAELLSAMSLAGEQRQGAFDGSYCASLHIASCYVLSCCSGYSQAGSASLPFSDEAVEPVVSLLTCSRQVAAHAKAKSERRHIVKCVEFLLMSLDWLFHDRRGDFVPATASEIEPTAAAGFQDVLQNRLYTPAKELAPAWLREQLFRERTISVVDDGASKEVAKPSHSQYTVPSHFRLTAQDALRRQDARYLGELFGLVLGKEEADFTWRLFNLTKWVGEALLSCPNGVQAPNATGVVKYLGTSAEPAVLTTYAIANRVKGTTESLPWLCVQRGEEAYAAVKQVLFHHPPDELAAIQASHGDILSGDSNATWQTALEEINGLMETGQSSQWRKQLPNALRLLSDAGQFKEFFRLAREYDPKCDGGAGNLIVADALAQAMRRTGQWQFHPEVLDLIASAPIPSSAIEDHYLEGAALQTLYALRRARKWKEAADVVGLLRPIMEKPALRLFASVLAEAAAASPTAPDEGEAPFDVVTNLMHRANVTAADLPGNLGTCITQYLCRAEALDDVDLSSLDQQSRQCIYRVCVQRGLWRPLRSYADTLAAAARASHADGRAAALSPRATAVWADYLRALEHCPEDLQESAFSWSSLEKSLPAALWQDERCVMQLFHTALWNGWLREFGSSLLEKCTVLDRDDNTKKSRVSRTRKEVSALVCHLQCAKPLPKTAGAPETEGRLPSLHSTTTGSLSADLSVRHSLIGHYYTSFVTRSAFRVAVDRNIGCKLTKSTVARYFHVPPVCVGSVEPSGRPAGGGDFRARSDLGSPVFLRPYPTLKTVTSAQVLLARDDFIIAHKPSGAILQTVARSVLACLGAKVAPSYHLAYLLPPGAEGLFLMVSTAANAKRFRFDLRLKLELIPLGEAHVALLSASFFQEFEMSLCADNQPSDEDDPCVGRPHYGEAVVRVEAMCRNLFAFSGSAALRSLKAALNQEGWTVVEKDVGAGESYAVVHVQLTDVRNAEVFALG